MGRLPRGAIATASANRRPIQLNAWSLALSLSTNRRPPATTGAMKTGLPDLVGGGHLAAVSDRHRRAGPWRRRARAGCRRAPAPPTCPSPQLGGPAHSAVVARDRNELAAGIHHEHAVACDPRLLDPRQGDRPDPLPGLLGGGDHTSGMPHSIHDTAIEDRTRRVAHGAQRRARARPCQRLLPQWLAAGGAERHQVARRIGNDNGVPVDSGAGIGENAGALAHAVRMSTARCRPSRRDRTPAPPWSLRTRARPPRSATRAGAARGSSPTASCRSSPRAPPRYRTRSPHRCGRASAASPPPKPS